MLLLRRLSHVAENQALLSDRDEIRLAMRRADGTKDTANLAHTLASAIKNSQKNHHHLQKARLSMRQRHQVTLAFAIWHDRDPWIEFLLLTVYTAQTMPH